jgi:hypothetical protein
MKVVVDIKDNKAEFFLELVKSLDFVKKVETETERAPTKKEILAGIKQAVKEVNLIKAGKMKGIPARQLLDEL